MSQNFAAMMGGPSEEGLQRRSASALNEIILHLTILLLGPSQPSATNLRRFAFAYRHARGCTSTSHSPLDSSFKDLITC